MKKELFFKNFLDNFLFDKHLFPYGTPELLVLIVPRAIENMEKKLESAFYSYQKLDEHQKVKTFALRSRNKFVIKSLREDLEQCLEKCKNLTNDADVVVTVKMSQELIKKTFAYVQAAKRELFHINLDLMQNKEAMTHPYWTLKEVDKIVTDGPDIEAKNKILWLF